MWISAQNKQPAVLEYLHYVVLWKQFFLYNLANYICVFIPVFANTHTFHFAFPSTTNLRLELL